MRKALPISVSNHHGTDDEFRFLRLRAERERARMARMIKALELSWVRAQEIYQKVERHNPEPQG